MDFNNFDETALLSPLDAFLRDVSHSCRLFRNFTGLKVFFGRIFYILVGFLPHIVHHPSTASARDWPCDTCQ